MNIQFIYDPSTLGDEIIGALEGGHYNSFRAAVAYVRDSGVVTIEKSLQHFTNSGGKASIVIGIDQKITSYQSLVNLLVFTDKGRNLFIHHTNQLNETYHPKVYIFGGENPIEKIIVGSSNMTRGGFYTNVEASIGIDLSSTPERDANTLKFRDDVEKFWSCLVGDSNTTRVTKPSQGGMQFLETLLMSGLLENEEDLKAYRDIVHLAFGGKDHTGRPFFGKTNRTHRMNLPLRHAKSAITSDIPSTWKQQTFAMTLSHFDTSSRSADPVILIPLKALRANKEFWKFPNRYTLSQGGYLQYYVNITVQTNSSILESPITRIYFYEGKKEFRFQCEYIKRNGKPNDIMQIESVSNGYKVTLIQKRSRRYGSTYKKLTSSTSGNGKKFGYF